MKPFILLRSALVLCSLTNFVSQALALPASKLDAADQIRKYYGLDKLVKKLKPIKEIKIAIIDNGFAGAERAGAYLPETTTLVAEYPADFLERYRDQFTPEQAELSKWLEMGNDHARRLAQVIWGMTNFNPDGPQFLLLNGNGITNFKRAVLYAIEQKADLILYSQSWECCGNFDGSGYINEVVNMAAAAGIIWINAAGNFKDYVYNGPINIKAGERKWLTFKDGRESLRVSNLSDDNSFKVTASWTAESNADEQLGTTKDLDIYVYDENGNEVSQGTGKKVQSLQVDKDDLAKETQVAREVAVINSASKNTAGKYYEIKIFAKGFTDCADSKERLRITVEPESRQAFDSAQNKAVPAMTFIDATHDGEIMVPADNTNVITVGEVAQIMRQLVGAKLDVLKPDVLMEISKAAFTDGQVFEGSSVAAAYFAAIVAEMLTENPKLTKDDILALVKLDKSGIPPRTVTVYNEPSFINRALYPKLAGTTTIVIPNNNGADPRIWKPATPEMLAAYPLNAN